MLHYSPPDIEQVRYLDPSGTPLQPLPDWCQTPDRLLHYYRVMQLCRAADLKAVALQHTGQIGTYPSTLGQEAIATVYGALLQPDDVMAPYYRDHAAKYQRGTPWHAIYQLWGGDEQGFNAPGAANDLPDCVPIATQCGHAVGVATAFKIRGEKRVALCSIGDGGTSKGDFMEALNTAGAWQLPLLFVINNNQWAISVPRSLQCHAETLAQKALAAGIPALQVDGNDVIALHQVLTEALEHARAGKGPTLIEALTYRLCDHTTADDASRYRPAAELEAAQRREPLHRLRQLLQQQGWWDQAREDALQAEIKTAVETEVSRYLALPAPDPADCFDHQYAMLPDTLAQQKKNALERWSQRGPRHE